MKINKNEVCLLKCPSENESDKYEELLKKYAFSVSHVQVLDFEFVNLTVLNDKLNTPDLYKGIIFTSPRAITATKLSSSELKEQWQHKKNYVVGETTYELAKKELGLICNGKESGNANNLADLIIKDMHESTFLFPCGNLKKEILLQRLNNYDIKLDTVTVYETSKYKYFESDFNKLTNNLENIPEYIVFFSPSGIKFARNLLKNCLQNDIKFVAIGPSTAEALGNENFPIFAIASKPTEVELLNAITKNTDSF